VTDAIVTITHFTQGLSALYQTFTSLTFAVAFTGEAVTFNENDSMTFLSLPNLTGTTNLYVGGNNLLTWLYVPLLSAVDDVVSLCGNHQNFQFTTALGFNVVPNYSTFCNSPTCGFMCAN
jgi:hypothetical protein